MYRLFFLSISFFVTSVLSANTIIVKNAEELQKANKEAKPGDVILLQDGIWNNISISLNCNGTKDQPITFKAQTAGKAVITGHSRLNIGGNYIIVDGFYFTKGYAGDDAIITFRISKKELANHCRVTNTVINDFNNPKRLDENYWVQFYGKNNRIDHCSFQNKKNMGVMMAVILDDDRSRENYHSIDHNYFGFRLPLASNTGETIRVGVSQHCEFNSNTLIEDNFFEHCDGETEIISIKSCSNTIRNNLFKECQGAVVLRHGNYNNVYNNIFLGNDKEGTGGVRVINKGQWVVNNLFYHCRGVGFRSPLAIMNGVPNSPANRYVAVTDAVIANNSFINCTPLGFCVGSDTERSVPPSNVDFLNNIYYNTSDSLAYHSYDNINGINFSGNLVSNSIQQNLQNGFIKSSFTEEKTDLLSIPVSVNKYQVNDSLESNSRKRISADLSANPGFANNKLFEQIELNARTQCGAAWFTPGKNAIAKKAKSVNCKTAKDVTRQLEKNRDKTIILKLTGKKYYFPEPIHIKTDVIFVGKKNKPIQFSSATISSEFLIYTDAGNSVKLKDCNLDLTSLKTKSFISTDTSGSSNHSNYSINNCTFSDYKGQFFRAAKTSVADSILVTDNSFSNTNGLLFDFGTETDKKGYYNAEKLIISNNTINNHLGEILEMQRTGNDESTMGPYLIFTNNKIIDCNTTGDEALIHLYGTQRSLIEKNDFTNSNKGKIIIRYEDIVSARHQLINNTLTDSGKTITDEFVESKDNTTR